MMMIGIGTDGVRLGEERSRVAARLRGRYREFLRSPGGACPTGVLDGRVFICYDLHDRVELLEVADPEALMDADGRPVPLVFTPFVQWLGTTPFVVQGTDCIVPSLSLALTFAPSDDDDLTDNAAVTIASIGIPGYYDNL